MATQTDLAAVEDVKTACPEEALAYARRGRGERNRPVVGWDSLTPTELEVVRHVTDGLANPEIACGCSSPATP